jgi:exonuclease VII large subunit
MLATNQTNIAKNYPDLNQERDSVKDRHIQRGIDEEKQRSQQWWETEQRRLDNARRAYRNDLDGQLNEKNNRQAQENESRVHQQQEFKKITFTPQEVAQYERERKLVEMGKYKQDLDKLTPTTGGKAQLMTGNAIVTGSYATSNDFNTHQEIRHDPMVNPMPYNIQNPYILREFMRKEQARQAQQNIFSQQP